MRCGGDLRGDDLRGGGRDLGGGDLTLGGGEVGGRSAVGGGGMLAEAALLLVLGTGMAPVGQPVEVGGGGGGGGRHCEDVWRGGWKVV